MLAGLAFGCAVFFCLCIVGWGLYFRSKAEHGRLAFELSRFRMIADLEHHANGERAKAEAAKAEVVQAHAALERIAVEAKSSNDSIATLNAQIAEQQRHLAVLANVHGAYANLDELKRQIEKQKQQVNQYNQALGNFKKSEELRAHIAQQQSRLEEIQTSIGRFDTIAALNEHIAGQQAQVAALQARANELNHVLGGADTAAELQARIQYQQNLLAEIQSQVQKVEEASELQEFGFYRPRYGFDSSSKYQKKLDQVRAKQTKLTKDADAVVWEKKWTVEGSEAQGRKMMAEQTKLMLRAFNGECDAAIAKIRYNNATSLEARINRSCEQINKLGKTNCASITREFLALKLEELYLTHEHRVKVQEEKEEQQRIKEQMREEEKAQREIEEAQDRAEREEAEKEAALDKARRALEQATRSQIEATEKTKAQNAELAAQVAKLENELKDAIDRKAKAIARAQLTKSGHVYVLSNIGSFGEGIYKLGMTRRFEPLERVKELGDASVPFPFDVHAIIYSENAPELETKLHRHFAHRRVNLVNLRREYFQITLDEIRVAVREHFGEVTFVTVPEAAEYRETIAHRKADSLEGPGEFDLLKLRAPADAELVPAEIDE